MLKDITYKDALKSIMKVKGHKGILQINIAYFLFMIALYFTVDINFINFLIVELLIIFNIWTLISNEKIMLEKKQKIEILVIDIFNKIEKKARD